MEESKIERIILIILWISSICSFSIALLMGHNLFVSNVVGLGGLIIVMTIYFLKRDLLLPALSILLILGMLNLASFVYFVNLTISFGFLGKAFTPGIQFYSLVLFFILALFRRPTYLRWLNRLIGKSERM